MDPELAAPSSGKMFAVAAPLKVTVKSVLSTRTTLTLPAMPRVVFRSVVRVVLIAWASVPATLSVFDLATDSTMASPLVGAGTFPFTDGNVQSPAFSACAGMVFVAGTNADLAVHAVSIAGIGDGDGGAYPTLPSTSAATGHSGQGVFFEPYTNTVIAPFSQGNNFALTAFTLAGTPDAPRLIQRLPPRWVPPPDLRPSFVATKSPVPDVCTPLGDN